MSSKKDLEEFDEVYPELLDFLVHDISKDLDLVNPYFTEMVNYTVPHGKKIRGRMVRRALGHLIPKDKQTSDIMKLGDVAGWCIEWFQACFLVHDDIMDESLTRRGEKCWYHRADEDKGLGLIAINDGLQLGSSIFILLNHYFKNQSYYIDLITLYHNCFHWTSLGQSMDMLTAPKNIDLDTFTMDRYKSIVKWKTSYYTFYLPVIAAFIIAGRNEQEKLNSVKDILLEIGKYFQVQDDYLDCYGNPEITGKVGTDIQDGKCSWLVVKAIEMSSPSQLKLLKVNYGKHDPESIKMVKSVYLELDMPNVYKEFEEKSLTTVNDLITNLNQSIPKELFHSITKSIYKRNK